MAIYGLSRPAFARRTFGWFGRRGGRLKLRGADFVDVVEVAIRRSRLGTSRGVVEGFGKINLRAKIVEALAEIAIHGADFFRDVWQVLAKQQDGDDADDDQFLNAEAEHNSRSKS